MRESCIVGRVEGDGLDVCSYVEEGLILGEEEDA